MRANALRTLLLIQAIEETDPSGEILPLSERTAATRAAVRDGGDLKHAFAGGRLSRAAERVMTARAEQLRGKIAVRSPVIDQLLHAAHGPRWIGQVLFAGAIGLGLVLSMLDGMGHISILAWPLALLIVWNLAAYARALTRLGSAPPASSLYSTLVERDARKLIAQSGKFHASLTDALQRFANDWGRAAAPLTAQQGRRLLHVAALCVAVGLVIGWCVRAFVFRDVAGWGSTFIGARVVLWFVHLLFAPAAALLGIPLPPDVGAIEQMRWSAVNPARGTSAWIQLLVGTAALYIVIPRIIALIGSSARRWNIARRLSAPPTLLTYTRGVLLNVSEVGHGVASVTPYAYSPDHYTMEGLENVLTVVLGGAVLIDARPPVAFGVTPEEGSAAADWTVILCTLASTPDAAAHGKLIGSCRDRLLEGRSTAPLLIAVDESPTAEHLGDTTVAAAKLAERRELWSEFVAGYGLPICLAPFARFRRGAMIDEELREQVQAAFWTPTTRR